MSTSGCDLEVCRAPPQMFHTVHVWEQDYCINASQIGVAVRCVLVLNEAEEEVLPGSSDRYQIGIQCRNCQAVSSERSADNEGALPCKLTFRSLFSFELFANRRRMR